MTSVIRTLGPISDIDYDFEVFLKLFSLVKLNIILKWACFVFEKVGRGDCFVVPSLGAVALESLYFYMCLCCQAGLYRWWVCACRGSGLEVALACGGSGNRFLYGCDPMRWGCVSIECVRRPGVMRVARSVGSDRCSSRLLLLACAVATPNLA
jgi:hypothetical protein